MCLRGISYLSLFVLYSFAVSIPQASAQPSNYRAGVVNVKEVQSQPDGRARHLFEVRQQLEGEAPTVSLLSPVSTTGAVTADEIPAPGDLVSDLTGEIYSNLKFFAAGFSSKNSLTPATVQDQSLGCRSASFKVQDRIASLANRSSSNADFSVGARFRVVDNRNRAATCGSGTCLVQDQIEPAPNYNGPLYFEVGLSKEGEFQKIDLKPFIANGSSAYTCALQTKVDQHGVANTGLAANPPKLYVGEDCVVHWDTSEIDLGEKYAFRTIITSAYTDPSCGKAYTELDLLLQAGCASGDLACLQCSDLDLEKVLADTKAEYGKMSAIWAKSIKQMSKLRKKVGSGYAHEETRYRRLVRQFTKKNKAGENNIVQTLASQPRFIQNCLRPSKLFCQSHDMSPIAIPVLAAVKDTESGTKKALRSLNRLQKIVAQSGGAKKPSAKKLNKNLNALTLIANNARAAISQLNGTVNQCQ